MKFVLMKNQKGFSTVEGVLILIIVAIIVGFTGWFVWHSKQVAEKTTDQSLRDSNPPSNSVKTIKTYDECIKAAGSKELETYPPICVTKEGKHFTQDTSTGTTQKYLTIKEWGVKFPLGDKTADAFYTKSDNGMVWITTTKLHAIAAKIGACHPDVDDIYLERSTTVSNNNFGWHIKIGNYYYFRTALIEAQCISQGQAQYVRQYQPIQDALSKELQNLTAE